MSLEQLTGAPLTLKADVYAFGTLMWETCSLQVPFVKQGNDIYKIRALVQAGTRLPALAPAAFDAHSKASQLHARFSLLIRVFFAGIHRITFFSKKALNSNRPLSNQMQTV